MKIAITAAGTETTSPIDQRFGRARYLLMTEGVGQDTTAIENRGGLEAAQGAGIQAAQKVIDSQAEVLITGHCGPKAFRALSAAGVGVYVTSDATVAEALARFEAGGLRRLSGADVDGHW